MTDKAGVGLNAVGMGAAVADYDNDGDLDLLVTTFGRNTLFRNNGDGTFADVTEAAGIERATKGGDVPHRGDGVGLRRLPAAADGARRAHRGDSSRGVGCDDTEHRLIGMNKNSRCINGV